MEKKIGFVRLTDRWVVLRCTRDFFGNNTVANRLCLSRLRDTGPAEQRSEQADMHLFVRCVFISTSSVSIHVSFFLSVSLWWVTSTPSSLRLHFCSHVSWPNLFFLQPCLIWYLFLKKKIFPVMQYLSLIFFLLLFALAFGCFLLKDTDNTCWQHRTPIFLQFLQPAVVSYRKKPPCPRLHSWKRPCVVTLKAELWASSDSCEKGAAADGKTCISKPLRGF